MRTIGLTGGIGSGKSVVARILSCYGVPIYDSDSRAKLLYDTDESLRASLVVTFGSHIYTPENKLDRKALASIIFSSTEALAQVNALVHPAVERDFSLWRDGYAQQGYQVCAVESALLVGGGLQSLVTDVLVVTADVETRIGRAMRRDGMSRDAVLQRMAHQASESALLSVADWLIYNDASHPLLPQIESLPWLPQRLF